MRCTFDPELYERLRIRSRDQIGEAAACLRDFAAMMCRMRVAATHNIASSGPMTDAEGNVLASSVFGFDSSGEAWWRAPNLALVSPLVALCRLEADPFWCNAAGVWTHHGARSAQGVDLTDFESRALTRSALVVPVHLPFGQVGAVSFPPMDAGQEDLSEVFDACADVLGLYARQFIVSYVHVQGSSRPLNMSPTLTRREVECLRWAALGKTNEEIATILGLSRSTVRFHIRNASEKLDAVNRDQTVYNAARLGYLASGRP
jgi:DNA-binding CsgD family transcriptional regulator